MGTGRLRMLIGAALAVAAVVAIAALGGTAGDDQTQVYANRQLQIMAAAAPGGGWDATARAVRVSARDAELDDGIVGAAED
jgi:tripartite-type tricarboxylate transporter receptor subunit TctC